LLPLTFSDPNDYEHVRESDAISLKGLKELSPGTKIECKLHHSDGTEEKLYLNHSFGESQIEWFKKGSAMNLFQTNQT
jgi:aconitate hydratase